MKNKLIKCYHVSPIKNRASILKHGLIPKASSIYRYPPRLFFSINEKIIGFDYAGFENIDVWSFYLPKSKMKKDKDAWNACFQYSTYKIESKNLKLEKT